VVGLGGRFFLGGIMIETVFINILSSLIYDNFKVFFRSRETQLKKEEDEIIKFLNTKDFSEYFLLLESSIFQEYINSPTVRDMIFNNMWFSIYDFSTSKIDKKNESCDILVNNLIKKYEQQDTITYKPSKQEIECFFNDILLYIDQFYKQFFSRKDKFVVAYIDKAINMSLIQISEKINATYSLIESTKKFDVKIRQDNYNQTKADYMRLIQEKNSRTRLYLEGYYEIKDFYVPPLLKEENYNNIITDVINTNFFYKSNIIYIIGGAGYGKTLLLKYLIINFNLLNLFDIEDHIIISAELRKFTYPAHNNKSILEFLQDSMIDETGLDEQVLTKDFIQYYLDRGRCIILLDALDEVDNSEREELHKKIITFFSTINPYNKICITSRDRGFMPYNKNISCYEILPLTRSQIETFLDKIMNLIGLTFSDRESFLKQTDVLIKKRFLNSFLVLKLLLKIYKEEFKLPENKHELYSKYFDYIAIKREEEIVAKPQGGIYNWNLIQPLLENNTFMELANIVSPNNKDMSTEEIKNCLIEKNIKKYGTKAETETAINEFLKFCTMRTELVILTSVQKYSFFHKSYFEYFYSHYIYHRHKDISDVYAKLMKFDWNSETFELTLVNFKKNNTVKYEEILDCFIGKIGRDFTSEKNNCNDLNAFILFLEVINDVYYKNAFIEILEKYKDNILESHKKIFNNSIISQMILDNKSYTDRINYTYYNNSITIILLELYKILIHERKKIDILTHYNEREEHFSLTVFSKSNNIIDILNNLNIENISFQHEIEEYCLTAHKKYLNLLDPDKEKVCGLLIKNI
jgi:hypothetical protein